MYDPAMTQAVGWNEFVDTKAKPEHERLTLLEQIFDPFSANLLDLAGVRPGWRCLEVGAGAGSVARMLAERAGPENVTATDKSVEFLAPLAEAGVRVLEHDAKYDDAPGEFDLIHGRFVVEHLGDGDAAVERFASWLRPGGVLVIESGYPLPQLSSDPVVGRSLTAMVNGMREFVGTDVTWASTLPLPFERAGLVGCDAVGRTVPARGGSPMAHWLRETTRICEDAAIAAGWITEEDLHTAYARYDDPSLIDYTWMTIGATGHRPML